MTDLLHVDPDFPIARYTHLIPSLEKAHVTVADLLTLDAIEIARRAHLPTLDVRRLANNVREILQTQLGVYQSSEPTKSTQGLNFGTLKSAGSDLLGKWSTISTLDPALDAALGGGIPTGYITEVTGESGAGKTQFLLTLLLAVQLAPPNGRQAKAIYISTEHALPTTRLAQLMKSNAVLSAAEPAERSSPEATSSTDGVPSLSHILTLQTPNLETQDHILNYQLPVALRAHRPALVVIDSIAANYRADTSTSSISNSGAALAARSASLARTGALLRRLAREFSCAVVVANQVSDRFSAQDSGRPAANGRAGPSSQVRPSQYPPQSSQLLQTLHSSQSAGHVPSSPSPAPSRPPLGGADGSAEPYGMGAAPAPDWDELSLPLHIQQRGIASHPVLALDHQARFFTGWEKLDDPRAKTPALGLVWANQIACRIALVKEAVWGAAEAQVGGTVGLASAGGANAESSGLGGESAEWTPRHWKRCMRLVFAPWAKQTEGDGVEFEIWAGGLRSIGK